MNKVASAIKNVVYNSSSSSCAMAISNEGHGSPSNMITRDRSNQCSGLNCATQSGFPSIYYLVSLLPFFLKVACFFCLTCVLNVGKLFAQKNKIKKKMNEDVAHFLNIYMVTYSSTYAVYSIFYYPIVILIIPAVVAAYTCPQNDIIQSMAPHTKLLCSFHKTRFGLIFQQHCKHVWV